MKINGIDAKKYHREYRRRWNALHPGRAKANVKRWFRENYFKIKTEVLSHYGKEGKLMCKWRGCHIADIDMLTLDHLGRRNPKDRTGVSFWMRLRKLGLPPGFQTLCWNHQWKKELARRRSRKNSYSYHERAS